MNTRNATYTQTCTYTGDIHNCKVENIATVEDEFYAPGGTMRVMRNAKGQAIAGPLLSELSNWSITEQPT